MKLKKLTIHNIASFEDAEIDFSKAPLADEHLFLICGKTGSGKSTIIDCLCLALYGNTPRLNHAMNAEYEDSQNKKTIRSNDPRQLLRRGTTNAKVTLTFDDNNGVPYIAIWEVHRSHNRPDGTLQAYTRTLMTEDGAPTHVEMHNSTDINKEIFKLIGLDIDQFFRTVVLAQGKFAEFLNCSEDDKSALLEKMTGTEIYTQISKKIYDVFREKDNQRKLLQEQLKSITLLSDDEKAQINSEMTTRVQEQAALAEQIEGAKNMLQWLNDKASNEHQLDIKRKDLTEKQTRVQEPAFVEKQRLVADWDATTEARHELKDAQDAERQIQTLIDAKPAMQVEYDRLCAGLRAAIKQLEAQKKQLEETDGFLRQEEPNSEMYKNIKSIRDQLKLRQTEQNNLVAYNKALDQEIARRPQVEKDMKDTGEAQQHQEERLRQLNTQYEAMNVAGIVAKKDALSRANEALTLLKSANVAVDEATTAYNDANDGVLKEQHELDIAQATIDDKRAIVKQARDAVDRENDMKNLLEQAHKSLHEGDKCPVCGRVIVKLLDPHGENVIEELRARQKQAEEDLKKTETAIGASQKAIKQLTLQASRLQEELAKKTQARDKQQQVAEQRLEQCDKHIILTTDNAAIDAVVADLNREAEQLSTTMKQAEDLNRCITSEREKFTKLTAAHNKAKNDLNLIKGSIEHQQKLIVATKEHIGSLTDNLNALFTMQDWQERIANEDGFVDELARKAADYRAKETMAQGLREAIGKTEVLIPAMQDNKDNVKGLDDNGQTCDEAPDNLGEHWRAFENKNIGWNNRLNNERQKAEMANKSLETYLSEHPAISMERLTLLSAQRQNEMDGIRQTQKALLDSITHVKGEISALDKRQEQIISQKPSYPEEDREKLADTLSSGQTKNHALTELIADLKARLKKDEDNLREVGEKKEALEKAEGEYQRWAEFCRRLGKADGKTFRNIAQSYILGELLHSANGYLCKFNNRYELVAKPATLVILVRDMLQGDLTSANTLSGGESFMVSLALALALSNLSGKMFTVDTIFIDEGFGSLSSDYLDKVMETLHRLYEMGGRRVGIISHVERLKEPITTKILVKSDDNNNTVSRIEVVEGDTGN